MRKPKELFEVKRVGPLNIPVVVPKGSVGRDAEIGPDTRVSIPKEVTKNNPLTVEDLMNLEWSRDWAKAMYKMATGKQPTEEDIRRIIKNKLLPEVS